MDSKDKAKKEYKPQEIEVFWQKKWEDDKTFTPSLQTAVKPYFNLMMFPYPSAEGLHVGNMYAFTGADVHGRFKRMQGNDVFEPIGLDGFGIHSENYALKVGRHPAEQAAISQKNFYRQLKATGNGYDWTRTVETYDPDYYRWTQWLFIQMFKSGLAYRKKAKVNWCPSDKTVLADEQVIDGKCERDGAIVEKRDLEQWFFRITDYSDRLLAGLDNIDWPEKIKIAQRSWIGKSKGARLKFKVGGQDQELEVFTTRPDTLYGATFMVISPEHPLVTSILDGDYSNISKQILMDIKNYVAQAQNKSEQDRTATDKEKTGVESGLTATNSVNGAEIPIYIADYVLMGYGTGAIMAVPAHDERDFEFAKKYNLPITQVIASPEPIIDEAYTGSGKIINSGDWDGWETPESIDKVIAFLEEKGIGKSEANYHLRDWLISRQRYWGPPIPMIFCQNCADKGDSWFTSSEYSENSDGQKFRHAGKSESQKNRLSESSEFSAMNGWYPAPIDHLPVLLPDVKDWKPMGSGESPLANHPEFYKTSCPHCKGEAKRETDVSDTFLDSAWYYLRYLSIGNDKRTAETDDLLSNKYPYDIDILKKWCPVAIYIGGAEHSVLHLLYVRFIAMVLHDLKFRGQIKDQRSKITDEGINSQDPESKIQDLALSFEEPFPRFFAHGLIVKDGAKMSKSKGNVVVPDKYIAKFGADTLRLYLMFIGQFKDGGDFRDSGIEGTNRFVKRVWKLLNQTTDNSQLTNDRLRMMHRSIKAVTEDLEVFSYNTAISKIMEWYNFLMEDISKSKKQITKNEIEVFLKLLAPFAPHMTEELWKTFGLGEGSVHFADWPVFDEKYLVQSEVIIPIQVNGKRRGEIVVESSKLKVQDEIEAKAKEIIKSYLEGKEIKKVIYVPGKIMNFVV